MTTKAPNLIDPADLSIVAEPYPGRQTKAVSKYAEIFAGARQGTYIACPTGSASKIAGQFKKYLVAKGHKDPIVRAIESYKNGQGGVWWLEKPRASAWTGLGKREKEPHSLNA